MIIYNTRQCTSMFRMRGSVFPNACLYALPSAVIAGVLKFIESQGWLSTGYAAVMKDSTVYNGFAFVLGFVLVFRTSQSYARYWTAATSVHTMRAEWYDACASLVAFARASKKPSRIVAHFVHTSVRLFSLLHAMAIEELADIKDEDFPLLDIGGFKKDDLAMLLEPTAQGRKVELVFQWIKTHIVHAVDDGTLNIPPPILTRVFQELGIGLVKYHEALQVVIWPFPFAYAQMAYVLIFLHMLYTPLVVCSQSTMVWSAATFTLISVACMRSLDLIAAELEQPFGDDPNDLPTYEMHCEFVDDLIMLVNPDTWRVPRLLACAATRFDDLSSDHSAKAKLSLRQYNRSRTAKFKSPTKKQAGEFWLSGSSELDDSSRLERLLGITKTRSYDDDLSIDSSGGDQSSELGEFDERQVAAPTESPEIDIDVTDFEKCPADEMVDQQQETEWHSVLVGLFDRLHQQLEQIVSEQMVTHAAHFELLEKALKATGQQSFAVVNRPSHLPPIPELPVSGPPKPTVPTPFPNSLSQNVSHEPNCVRCTCNDNSAMCACSMNTSIPTVSDCERSANDKDVAQQNSANTMELSPPESLQPPAEDCGRLSERTLATTSTTSAPAAVKVVAATKREQHN
eukprot:TRINITY_DN11022_c0_g2_i1.p1 TRINITY_DN11022_c0_g2~~TRINITY_DN11022_c0_g2_i1.p1  ORF type:complete len:626 (+),score=84.02 TRINITY_DN11022_c0_g2_i1:60-1937(+)